jgi:hypothetical protein
MPAWQVNGDLLTKGLRVLRFHGLRVLWFNGFDEAVIAV